MASLSFSARGVRLLVVIDDRRPAIWLGHITKSKAEKIKHHVEALATARRYALAVDNTTAAWLETIDNTLHDRIAATGLLETRRRSTLGAFLKSYADGRTVKKSTEVAQGQGMRRLKEYFGEGRALETITEGEAREWLTSLADAKYSPATIGRTTGWAKQFFRAAFRSGLIKIDPFAAIKAKQQVNADRLVFVDRPTIAKLLRAVMDPEWRLIIALARYGGLRCPSEHLGLTWGDVEHDRFWVTSPKTEHHPNGDGRWVPMFPELRPFFAESRPAKAKTTDFVIRLNRVSGVNYRTQLLRFLDRAKITAWPRLFQNLRASRETELAAEYPLHVAAAWIGNGALVAHRHYLTVREEDFAKASSAQSSAGESRNAPTCSEMAHPNRKTSRKTSDSRGERLGVIGTELFSKPGGKSAILPFVDARFGSLREWWEKLTEGQRRAVRRVACCGRRAG